MQHLDQQIKRHGLRARGLPIVESGARLFFARDVQPLVLQACQQQDIAFDFLAQRFGLARAGLALVLRGHDPVPPQMLRLLDDFVARAQAAAMVARVTQKMRPRNLEAGHGGSAAPR